MKQGTRIALLAGVLALACNSPDTALFGTPGPGPMGSAGSNTGGNGGGSGGSGAATSGGTSMMGGEGSGAAPTAGSAGTGQAPSEGGADGDPMTGDGGADQGTGGAPPDPPEPVCGNGKLEGTEECDDNGHEGKDGCNANCEVVCSDFDEEAVESADHHCYAGYDSADFDGAQAACEELGAHLATIASAAENEIAASFVSNSKFIGGFEMVDEMDDSAGTYEWVTGEPFEYENWGEEQPDQNATRCNGGFSGPYCYSHCAAMNGQGTWMDQRCDLEDGYVCEWEPAGD